MVLVALVLVVLVLAAKEQKQKPSQEMFCWVGWRWVGSFRIVDGGLIGVESSLVD